MVIGKNHIVDIQEAQNVQLANGTTTNCRWYQFKIPIREPDQTIGNINGFQSIRFMRMFLNGFQDPVILRFATLELVYGTWRKYSEDLLQPGDYPTGMGENTSFTLSTVNIEENGSRQPVPYNLPPNIERESWYSTSSSYTELNEQALELDIQELNAGDARAIYRNAQYDLRYYGKLKMFVHAEKKYELDHLYDGDLTLFVRLGSDYTNNYYEYELPLTLTPWGTSADSKEIIWPGANQVEIDLQKLVEIKTNRNRKIRSGEVDYNSTMLYSEMVDGRRYTIMGTPNLGKVKVIMVGVRNPRKQTLDDGNDMLPKSAIVWINEMRLADYINKGGWAAMALARTNLADAGNLSLYTSYTTSGFGNLEDKLNKIELVNTLNIQSTLNLEMGKFLPDEWGMHIPLYLDYNNQIGSPEYNPLDPDVKLKDDLKTYKTQAERDSIKKMTQQRHQTTNLTLTNMRKERTGKSALKPHFYDFENFSFSYSYSGERSSDDDIEYYNKDQHQGGISYNFAVNQPKQFKPFDKLKPFQNKNLKFIKDFNLYYQPKNVSFNTKIYRDIESTLLRNKSAALVIMNPTYFKQFTWERDYNVQYDLARSFHITYDAVANARIDEPPGQIDRTANDSIWTAIMRGGTMQNFRQDINITWDLPISKLPYMDFLRLPLTYRTTYIYNGTTQALASQGSVINNNTTINLPMQANFQTLYNKSKLLKKAYAQKPKNKKDVNKKGKDADKDRNELDKKRNLEQRKADAALADSLRRVAREEMLRELGYFGLRFVTGVKSVNITYNNSYGATIAGFMGESRIIGLDPSNLWQPGLPFVLGLPENNPFSLSTDGNATSGTVESLLQNDLLSHDTLMNTPNNASQNSLLTFQTTIEPIRDFIIKSSAHQNYSTRQEYYYKYSNATGSVEGPLSNTLVGNYTTSAWSFRTAFRNSDDLFNDFIAARGIAAARLARLNPDPYSDLMVQDTMNGEWYPAGYGANQQTVLLTAFLATYLGKDVSKQSFSPFLTIPLPDWDISYNGLAKIDFFKKWFTQVSIQHKYKSDYTIGNFYTDAAIGAVLEGYDYGTETVINNNGDYISPVSMDGVIINEQFQPLIMLSVSMVNSLQFKLRYDKIRSLNLSFVNNQLTETYREGITFGTGYRFKDLEFHVKASDKEYNLKSDLVLQLDITYNNNMTQIRKINQMSRQISSGSKIWMARVRAEYALSSTLTLQAFFETNINTPYISNAYPNSTTKGGLTVRFSF
jgi:cell surface protein SprA